jgi:hypothetical protein
MRELAAAGLLLLALTVAALTPAAWPGDWGSGALASGSPPPTGRATMTSPPRAASPQTDTSGPRDFALPATCRILAASAQQDGKGATWTVHCGSARANLDASVAAIRQGWIHLEGPPIGVGLQSFSKGPLTMQVAYRLDGPGFSDPFQLVQYWRPFAANAEGPLARNAYLRAPAGIVLPSPCLWREAPAGFTSDGAYKLPFACPSLPAAEIRGRFHEALLGQGWRVEYGGFGFMNYAKADFRIDVFFANENAEPSDTPWIVESLCCLDP